MHIGIRGKIAATLIVAGLLPLALSLVIGLLGYRQGRRELVGQSFVALARQQADLVSALLGAEVEFFQSINQLPGTAAYIDRMGDRPPLSENELAAIELRWPTARTEDLLLGEVLNNDLAQRWQSIQRTHPRISEVLITDRTGRLVAATNRTTDYFQADESWWMEAWAEGRGRTHLEGITFDTSAISETGNVGCMVVSISLPIYRTRRPGSNDQPAGIMKVLMDATWLLSRLREIPMTTWDPSHRGIWLIRRDGRPIEASESSGMPELPPQVLRRVLAESYGYLISDDLPQHEVIGYSRVALKGNWFGETADWHVIVTASRTETFASMRSLLWTMTLAGAGTIIVFFLVGLHIAHREVLQPISALERGARELERSRLDYRLPEPDSPGSVFRRDELGQLAADFNRMAVRLEQNLAELDRANRVKQQFIDVASHELRTPITYILGVSELAKRQSPELSQLLTKISTKAQRLNRIVENMFKLLRTGSYESVIHAEDVDIAALVSTAAAEVEPYVQARHQNLDLKLPERPVVISADDEMLRDVIGNLLSNAIRFSPDRTTIGVQVIPDDENVELRVCDQGSGIPTEHLAHVFEPFYTDGMDVPHHSSGEYQYMTHGIGLGLSIVKRFVDLHKGNVRIESSSHGTCVYVTLPSRVGSPS